MTDVELLEYIRRIVRDGPERKVRHVLTELREILERMSTPKEQIDLVNMTILSLPEAMHEARKAEGKPLTERDLRIAARRAEERRRREAEMYDFGRC